MQLQISGHAIAFEFQQDEDGGFASTAMMSHTSL